MLHLILYLHVSLYGVCESYHITNEETERLLAQQPYAHDHCDSIRERDLHTAWRSYGGVRPGVNVTNQDSSMERGTVN